MRNITAKLVISFITIGLIGSLFLSRAPALADTTYFVGDTIIVPITYTSNLPVVAANFTVTVTNGTFVSMQCGGSGFLVNNGSGNQCTVAHLPPGSSSSTVAVATVKATAPGTLTVTAAGSLDAVLNILTQGTYTGGTFQIENSPTSTPSSTPASTSTSTTQNTPASTAGQSSSSSSSGGSSVESSSQSTTTQSKSTTTKTTTTSGGSGQSTSSGDTSRLIITAQDVKNNQEIPVGNYQEVFFTADALPAATQPVILDFPDQAGETWLNFSSYMEPGQATPEVLLPQAVILRNQVDGHSVTTTLPQGETITVPETSLATGGWDGRLLAPTAAVAQSGNQKTVTLSIGASDRTTELGKPAEIVFEGYSGWQGWVRQDGQADFQQIDATCASDTSATSAVIAGTCQQSTGGNLQIWTTHFSQFRVSHAVISWEVIVLTATEVLLLLFILITLRAHALRSRQNTSPPQPSKAAAPVAEPPKEVVPETPDQPNMQP